VLAVVALVLMLAMAAYDLPALVRLKEWGEIAVYLSLWVAGLVLAFLQISLVEVPSPTTAIIKLFSPLGEAMSTLLGLP